jgi:hypothetical protein
MAQTRTPHFWNHQLPCFWHETIPVRSADHEVVARYHGSRRHFVRFVLRYEHGQWFLAGNHFFVRSRMTPKKTNYLWMSSRDLWRHILVTSFPQRIYDVIFWWRHFLNGFMTSYFGDVISSTDLWRHLLVTSFPQRIYDVIFWWRHFLNGFMTSYFGDVISSPNFWPP